MTTKQIIKNSLFVSTMVVLVGSLLFRLGYTVRARSGPIPYTVKLKSTVLDSEGKLLPADVTMTVAVRSDGSRSVVHSQVRPTGPEVTRNIHFSSGDLITVGDLWDIKTSWRRPRPDITKWHRDPGMKCTVSLAGKPIRRNMESFDGEEMLGNIRTIKLTNGKNSEWFAVDHGCAMVRARYDFGDSVNEQVLVSLIPGDPDPALFHAPETFKEVGPADFNEVRRKKLTLPCNSDCAAGDRTDNQRYLDQAQRL